MAAWFGKPYPSYEEKRIQEFVERIVQEIRLTPIDIIRMRLGIIPKPINWEYKQK